MADQSRYDIRGSCPSDSDYEEIGRQAGEPAKRNVVSQADGKMAARDRDSGAAVQFHSRQKTLECCSHNGREFRVLFCKEAIFTLLNPAPLAQLLIQAAAPPAIPSAAANGRDHEK